MSSPDILAVEMDEMSSQSASSISDHIEVVHENPQAAAPQPDPVPQSRPERKSDLSRRSSSYKPERRTTDIMDQYDNIDPDVEKANDAANHLILPHFRAVLFRRWITIKRTWLSLLLTIICTVIISCLAIICQVLVETLVKPRTNLYSFDLYTSKSNQICVTVGPGYTPGFDPLNPSTYPTQPAELAQSKFQYRYIKAFKDVFHEDTDRTTDPIIFYSQDTMLKYIYDMKFDFENPNQSVIMAVVLPTYDHPDKSILLYNDTQAVELDMSSLLHDQSLSTMNYLRVDTRAKAYLIADTLTDYQNYLMKAQSGGKNGLKDGLLAIKAQLSDHCTTGPSVSCWDKLLSKSDQLKQLDNAITALNNGATPPATKLAIAAGMNQIFAQALGETFGLKFELQMLPKKVMDKVFGQLGPLLIVGGISSVISTFITGPIIDINGPIRSYMQSCTLSIFPYWFATYIIDFCVWTIDITVVWAVFMICNIKAFVDNPFNSWYIFFIGGLSFILYIYAISYCFSSADMAARNAFIINVILLIIPVIIDLVTGDTSDIKEMVAEGGDKTPHWVNWIYCLFPNLVIERFLREIFLNIGVNKHELGYYFSNSTSWMFAMFQFLGIVLWGGILAITEFVRVTIQRKNAKSSFGDYGDFFREAKAKHPVTQEANDMAEEVANSHNYAVRIENCSRMFFNTAGDPIPAVNCVSLGVQKGSTFGFLGANGAGKTTLINMITSMLPISDGTIEINGIDIMKYNDPTLLAVCPQFNTHLCVEMTPGEIFHFYSMLHQMAPDHEERNTEKLLQLLDLSQFKDTPIRELSEGDVRKVAIALSFLGRAEIILLDEPTATLDPVSRHQVHEMVSFYKGKKTFMLCTHLLSEAETLCDMISIMIKGNVYTCGSPQYLAAKFGTDYKIDMMLTDESPETAAKVDAFFEDQIPQAVLSIVRPTARIYNCPANSVTLAQLFDKMENGKKGDNGFNYYTCSSSSLERVFMEIVRISEGGEDDDEALKKIAPSINLNPDEDEKKKETNHEQPNEL